MNGIVILDKPASVTSFKALSALKRAYSTKRVGHTGTLDPDATGVLPALIGKATRAASLITAEDKEYTARLRLGVRTDTLDLSGKITEERPVNVTENDIINAVGSFKGETEQLPPMYSAISVGGKRLYELAREGVEIEREKRNVTIYSILVTDISLPFVTINVSCSKGTYIRTLADDIGQALGTLAAVDTLRRTRVGEFDISMSHTLEEISADPMRCLLPLDTCFKKYRSLSLSKEHADRVKNGVPIYFDCKNAVGEILRLYDETGEFIALSEVAVSDGRKNLKLIKGFY